MKLSIPYGRSERSFQVPAWLTVEELAPHTQTGGTDAEQQGIVMAALQNPIGSPPLRELARDKKKIVILASDHTRPVPSRFLLPPMLAEIRSGNPEAEITILIATGCHRETTQEELRSKLGDLADRERVVVHDCDSPEMVDLGMLPSGGRLRINALAAEADLLVAEGFIEPHFFAGFSGGRKSILPGIASRETVLYNHNADFIADPRARSGVLEGNPIHTDMLWAAKQARLAFILNVCIDGEKRIIHAVAGDVEKAHQAGCDYVRAHNSVSAPRVDLAVTSNGGYPLDQNLYQAVKGMSTAADLLTPGGVLIMASACEDGLGGDFFYRTFAEAESAEEVYDNILRTPRTETVIDQWQSQILAKVLMRCRVIVVSELDAEPVRAMHIIPAKTMEEAFLIARDLLSGSRLHAAFLKDGVSTMVSVEA